MSTVQAHDALPRSAAALLTDDMAKPAPTAKKSRRLSPSQIIGPVVLFAIFIGLWYAMRLWGLRFFFDKDGIRLLPSPVQVWQGTMGSPVARHRYIEGIKWTSIVAFAGLSAGA